MNKIETPTTSRQVTARQDLASGDSFRVALRDLLDPSFDDAYERLTLLATKLLKVPVSIVSVDHQDRQFFKSSTGLGDHASVQRLSPVTKSYCRHVIDTGEILQVSDATTDPDLMNDPATTQLGVVAYLGVPMTLDSGETLGSFCAINTVPHSWSAEDVAVMKALTDSLMREIQLRLALKRSEAAKAQAVEANERVMNILESVLDTDIMAPATPRRAL